MDRQLIVEVERVAAVDERRLAGVLAVHDPAWRSTVTPVADGWLVLWGRDLFVNHCMAAGLDGPLTAADVDVVEVQSEAVGVSPAFEFCDATRPDAAVLLQDRGWLPSHQRAVLVRDLTELPSSPAEFDVSLVRRSELATWLNLSAAGWGHRTERAVAANHAVGAAAFVADDPGLLLARDLGDGRPVGCAALRITDGVATLGGMSTHPDERNRGVQGAMIGWRLRYAGAQGCRYAVTMTEPGSASERNLRRFGFTSAYTKTVWRPAQA